MLNKTESAKEFLTRNDAVIDRLREVALREFERGADGLGLIIQELQTVQKIADEGGMAVLRDCLNDICSVLQGWLGDAVFLEQLASLRSPWADVIYELSNYFVFMGDEDENDLRNRVSYRLVQLAKASAALAPAPAPVDADGSWGLFDESAAPPLAVAPVPIPVAGPASAESAKPTAAASTSTSAQPTPEPSVPAPTENHLASHYLICLLGSQQYALPIHQVREILEQRHEKPLPSPRPGIMGLVTVRGLVCPVVDVSHILHSKNEGTENQDSKTRCTVVCEVDRRTFCFNVDDVKQVASIEDFEDQITPLNPENSVQKAISHVSHFQNRSVLFVKMREVIPA